MTLRAWSRSLGTSWWIRPLVGREFAITTRTWPPWIAIRRGGQIRRVPSMVTGRTGAWPRGCGSVRTGVAASVRIC
jgi:hypothetical protein